MEYMSVKEAAEKWRISERYVQRYCATERIEGAVKFGCSWAIPLDAEKPADMRQRAAVQKAANQKMGNPDTINQKTEKRRVLKKNMPPQKLHTAMPLLNTSWPPGKAMDFIPKMEDADTRQIALAEYYYFSGQSAKASDIAEEYLPHEDLALRLSAC